MLSVCLSLSGKHVHSVLPVSLLPHRNTHCSHTPILLSPLPNSQGGSSTHMQTAAAAFASISCFVHFLRSLDESRNLFWFVCSHIRLCFDTFEQLTLSGYSFIHFSDALFFKGKNTQKNILIRCLLVPLNRFRDVGWGMSSLQNIPLMYTPLLPMLSVFYLNIST